MRGVQSPECTFALQLPLLRHMPCFVEQGLLRLDLGKPVMSNIDKVRQALAEDFVLMFGGN